MFSSRPTEEVAKVVRVAWEIGYPLLAVAQAQASAVAFYQLRAVLLFP
ncbi:hypothetical protein [Vulcanisaeta souniana]|nr:hypothetical protein [Vulcanisaeta souniana]